jgi:hypothetical protein
VCRGYPKELDLKRFVIDVEWDEKLERFLTELGIEKPEGQDKPKWWVATYWG